MSWIAKMKGKAPADIKSKAQGEPGVKCKHCGEQSEFMRVMSDDGRRPVVCMSCGKEVG
ncbi:MAG: hypothetical protein GWN01_01225 [Nitrosopumilaceae archaeon]|nr:hypothetical protein [Nitrosopumilaceae archaeon]NIU85981.1 hypothetical protein [Nitrosopumilaceae archaeon]NIX60200.1 hypothetical protein [Nitrosopumilaceae archaeon]